MGKNWGSLFYLKNVVYFRVSSYELNPFANFWKKSLKGIKHDFSENGVPILLVLGATYFCINWANEANRQFFRKKPGQFDHEK